MRMNLTTLFTLPVELDSENSIATQPSDAKTTKDFRATQIGLIGLPKKPGKSLKTTTYPEEESSEIESEATDNDELPKNDQGM